MMPTKALQIDSKNRTIREIEIVSLASMQRAVGGFIERVPVNLLGDDDLWCDEEGMFKPQSSFFMIVGHYMPIAGNGLVTGRETEAGIAPPRAKAAELKQLIRWMTRDQADAWAKANASDPALTYTQVDPATGEQTTEILVHVGRMFRDMPRPEGEE